jgi:hypothetical protein
VEVGGIALPVEPLELPPPPHAARVITSAAVAIPEPILPGLCAFALNCIKRSLGSWWGFADWAGDCRHGKGVLAAHGGRFGAALGVDLATPLSVVHFEAQGPEALRPRLAAGLPF